MVRKRKSWREATIISRLDPNHWRAEYPGGGSGMFREADIRAYDHCLIETISKPQIFGDALQGREGPARRGRRTAVPPQRTS